MKKICLSGSAYPALRDYLISKGYWILSVPRGGNVHSAIASHPDIYMCKLGASPDSPVFHGSPEKLTPDYPGDARYNALCVGRHFIHNLKCTDPALLAAAEARGLIPTDVGQGYAKCSAVAVSDECVVTSDPGIAKALQQFGDVDILTVTGGYVGLPGFPTGFLGGASGRVGDEIIFCGDLTRHPDGARIRAFIESHDLSVRDFRSLPLLDIGTIMEYWDEV